MTHAILFHFLHFSLWEVHQVAMGCGCHNDSKVVLPTALQRMSHSVGELAQVCLSEKQDLRVSLHRVTVADHNHNKLRWVGGTRLNLGYAFKFNISLFHRSLKIEYFCLCSIATRYTAVCGHNSR